jgi:hypothetical protein
MNEDDKLHRLLRLKRYEQPPEEFAGEFLEKFQRRQRGELMRRSALGLCWERLQAWMDGLRRPAFLWTAAAAYALVMAGFWLWPKPVPDTSTTMMVGSLPPPQVSAPVVSTNPSVKVNHTPPPGKRRTPAQDQEKERVIGPEATPSAPLRDL